MSGYLIQASVFVVGLLLFVLFYFLQRNGTTSQRLYALLVAGFMLIIAAFLLRRWEPFQCKYTVPDKIRIAGYVKGNTGSYLNNYLVTLYRENDQVARAATAKGRFDGDRSDEEKDGYFELEIPNIDQLSRCSMLENFRQDGFTYHFLGLEGHTYLWRHFGDLAAGTSSLLNKDEGKKIYSLVILPVSLDKYPEEILPYPTYLDKNGNVAINVPIKTYSILANGVAENSTEYYVIPHPAEDPIFGAPDPAALEVQDAWVSEGSIKETAAPGIPDDEIIDIDNCGKSSPKSETIKANIIYIHEVQFQEDTTFSYDLGTIALKAAPSLGFMQGLVDTKEATENVIVPPGKHMKYIFYWQEEWKKGVIVADVNQSPVQLAFRARDDMKWYLTNFLVECP